MKKNYHGAFLTGILHFNIPVCIFIFMLLALPKFAKMFNDMGIKLPSITQFIIDSGTFIQSFWFIAILPMLAIPFLSGLIYFKLYQKFGRWPAYIYSAAILCIELAAVDIIVYGIYLPWLMITDTMG